MDTKTKEIVDVFIDIIYPQNISCIICNKPINKSNTYSLCRECFENIEFIQDGCLKCGKKETRRTLEEYEFGECEYCKGYTYYFDRAISCIDYSKISKKMILNFKYKDKTYMSRYIADIMSQKIQLENIKYDYILYVPLHKKRLKERGFNQSQKIAKYFSEKVNIECLDIIKRTKNTKKLYSLIRDDRKKELINAFEINDSTLLENKNVLIIDDILTTGSTVNEISKRLKVIGVDKIYVFTFLSKCN